MSGYRLPEGGALIDRARPVAFRFDGTDRSGFAGDTVASALLADGQRLFGRSFKYHRPRGILGAGVEEPNALMTLGRGASTEPNIQATISEIYQGLEAQSQNRWPSLRHDFMSWPLTILSQGFKAGFYYKTFMGPGRHAWRVYEPIIRKAAGLGRADPSFDESRYEKTNAFCDVLVVGAGPAGLAAARRAARAGLRVILADETQALGGDLFETRATVEGQPAQAWAKAVAAELDALPNVRVLTRTSVYGYYDGNVLGAVERVQDHLGDRDPDLPRQRHWTLHAGHVILAAGAIQRPIVFPGNDLPGVMLANAVERYIARYAVAPGRRAVVFGTDDSLYRSALAMVRAGIDVAAVVDARPQAPTALAAPLKAAGVPVHAGTVVTEARGSKGLSRVFLARCDEAGQPRPGGSDAVDADLLAVAGGWTPTIHLASQAGGAPQWRPDIDAFVPGAPREAWTAAGAANGTFALADVLADGLRAADAALAALGRESAAGPPIAADDPDAGTNPPLALRAVSSPTARGKAFVDFQNDVLAADVTLAHQEGYRSVEHLKRYTTLGMATDQGKTSNVNALGLMADLEGRPIPDVGTTRFRPPYTPVSLGALAGREVGDHFRPTRRTPMHDWHLAHGAEMVAAGAWMRPRAYLRAGESLTDAYIREARTVREAVGIVDVSTLGKITVQGPDAGDFLNRVYVNGFGKLPVGKARYGVMLREDGFVYDDGTTWRLAEDDFLMTTTTANAAGVLARLERHLAVDWPDMKVAVASATDQWAGLAIAGPLSREVLARIVEDVDMSDAGLPFMGVARGRIGAAPVIVARLSFSGELAYEVHCGARDGLAVWEAVFEAGQSSGLVAYGTEALGTLRIEKGHVAGAELDGRTTLADLRLEKMASSKKAFVGQALMTRPAMTAADRKVLVGLKSLDGQALRTGAHVVSDDMPDGIPSLGHVTSPTYSPALGAHIALALVSGGRERTGQHLSVVDPIRGAHPVPVEVVSHHFYDPQGDRLNG
ncbi:sarcosine oxidase subunit alpha family protein [Amorphus orientalis]|uniref:Sarcosine oxidase subunit alpha n=1 Tax=Amorphus orientalis TaxID=649198 RepID=A0AAE4AUP9_9HYPH|nr:sarcosine oxidase subunit alpha family protein [Amorphus orientalis]MDQ0317683.1 sarcosine oxidase subunit alpha [Amorphus orientalis]